MSQLIGGIVHKIPNLRFSRPQPPSSWRPLLKPFVGVEDGSPLLELGDKAGACRHDGDYLLLIFPARLQTLCYGRHLLDLATLDSLTSFRHAGG